MTKQEEIAWIARKLGSAQKRVVMALSAEWGPSGNHAAATRLWCRQDIPLLLDHRHQTDDCWSLRPKGIAVRAYLRSLSGLSETEGARKRPGAGHHGASQ